MDRWLLSLSQEILNIVCLFPIAPKGDNQNREQGQKHRDKVQTGRTFQGEKRSTTAIKRPKMPGFKGEA